MLLSRGGAVQRVAAAVSLKLDAGVLFDAFEVLQISDKTTGSLTLVS
jgi:hypothetical protein